MFHNIYVLVLTDSKLNLDTYYYIVVFREDLPIAIFPEIMEIS